MVQDQDFASDLVPLVGRLKSQVQTPSSGLWPRLLVIARARFPLRREDVLSLAELSGEHAPLLTQCVGYGDELIRIPETVRDALLDNTDDQTDAHQRLALQYQRRDGALAPLELSGEQLKTWLEKTITWRRCPPPRSWSPEMGSPEPPLALPAVGPGPNAQSRLPPVRRRGVALQARPRRVRPERRLFLALLRVQPPARRPCRRED